MSRKTQLYDSSAGREEFLWQSQWEYKKREAWEMNKERLGTNVHILLKAGSKVLTKDSGRRGSLEADSWSLKWPKDILAFVFAVTVYLVSIILKIST